MNKFNFGALAKAFERLDDSNDGMEGRCGNWEFRLGGYDHGYGIYFKGQEIGRVNYELKQYELYDEDFISKEQLPEFLAAIDARRFKDVGEHEGEFADEDQDMLNEDEVKKRKLTGARSHITKDGMRGWTWDPKRDGYYITKSDFPEKFMDKFVPFLKGLRNEHCELDMWANSKNRLFIRWVGEKTKDKHWWHKLDPNGSPANHEMASFAQESLKEFVEEIEKFIEKSDLADVIQVKPNWRFWEGDCKDKSCNIGGKVGSINFLSELEPEKVKNFYDNLDTYAMLESRKVNEARKQIMWAINFRNMRTAVHGMFYGKDKKRVEEFAKEIEYIQKNADWDWDEKQYAWESLYEDYPDIATMDEFNYRDIVDLPGGYEGIEDDETVYRFVNRGTMDIYNESTRKQKMKFRKIVKESGADKNALKQAIYDYGKACEKYGKSCVGEQYSKQDERDAEFYANKKRRELFGLVGLSGYDESSKKIVKESSNVAKFRRSIEAAKSRIIRTVDRNGVVENLGQDEVRRLRDTLDDMVFSGECEKSDELQMGRMLDNFDDWASTYTGKIVKEADEGDNHAGDTPKIYVGTYAKYNDGSLDGKWVDLTEYDTYEDFLAAMHELHSDEDDPEFMVQDFENFPEKWYHEGGLPTEEEFNKINDYYMMDDSRKEAYEVFVNYTGLDSIEDFEEAYEGQFNSPEDFGYYAVDTWGIPENPEYYIDYEAFGRDLTMDWHQGDPDETDAEGEPEDPDYYYDNDGYQQMEYGSDSEVGEQYIDDIGLDNLGTDTLNNYFDYEEYGRTLLVNDFWEDSGYIFREI